MTNKTPLLCEYDLKSQLVAYLTSVRQRNPRFSLRALGRQLGVNATSLSLYLNGQRELSKATCQRILHRFNADGLDKDDDYLAELARSRHTFYGPDDVDKVALISHWLPLAVLSFLETRGATTNAETIAKRLSVSVSSAQDALDLLIRLKLLIKQGKNWKPSGVSVSGGSLATAAHVRKAQFSVYERSTWTQQEIALGQKPSLSANYSMSVVAIDPANLDKARAEIARFRRRLTKMLETGDRQEVYLVGIDLLPLSVSFKPLEKGGQ